MPLSGHIDLGHVFGDGTAAGTWYQKGGDGKHYVSVGGGVINTVAQAESLSIIWTQDGTDWRTDLNAAAPTGYSGTATDYSSNVDVWPVVGTSKFYASGIKNDGSQTVLLRYNIDNTGSVVFDAAFVFTSSSSNYSSPAWLFGTNSFGGYTYFVTWGGKGIFDNGTYFLIRIPTSGVFASSVWADYVTEFQPFGYFNSTTSRRYSSRVAIVPDAASGAVGILSYLGFGEIADGVSGTTLVTAGSEYWLVDPATHTVISGPSSLQSTFGQPWPDSGHLISGAASADANNDYGAPIVNAVSGGYELIFGRPFTDAPTEYGFRRFFMDGVTGAISAVDTFQGTVAGLTGAQPMVFAARDGGDLLIGVTNQQDWYFDQLTKAAAVGAASGSRRFVSISTPLNRS